MGRKSRGLTAYCALMWVYALATTQVRAEELRLTPLVAEVLAAPRQVGGSDGRYHLVYELQLVNATPSAVVLEKIEALDRKTGKPLLTLGRDDIAKRFSIGGRRGALRMATTVPSATANTSFP